MGVVMFFSLTGYLLFWPFVKRIFETGERINLKQYALNRAFRILPLYFFAVTLLMFLKGGGSIGEWLRWATFTTNFDVSLLDLDGPLWSVSVEIHYYILLPFLAFAIGWLARGSLARAALVLFVLGAASFAVALALIEPGVASTAGKTLPGKFFYFVPGMLVALLRLHWQRHPPTYLRGPLASTDLWLGAAIVIMILQAFQVHYFLGDLREFNKFPDYTVAFFLIVGACVLPLKPGLLTRCLEWRALAMLGVASYSFYVWHHPILAAIAGRQQWPVLEFFALTLPLAIVVAFVSYYGVESPFLRLRGKWASSAPSHVAREPATSPESPPPADSKEAPEEGETADARRGDAPAVAGVRGSEPPA